MMQTASWYQGVASHMPSWNPSEDTGIELDYISIFLTLHVPDSSSSLSSRGERFDAIWPSNMAERDDSSNSNSPGVSQRTPTTPSKNLTAPPHSTHPLSPRSPNPASPVSPSRRKSISSQSALHSTPHQSRSSSQHLYALKQKLPYILKMLSSDEVLSSNPESSPRDADDEEGAKAASASSFTTAAQEFILPKQAVDHLSFIIASGTSRSCESSAKLSSLQPFGDDGSGEGADAFPYRDESKSPLIFTRKRLNSHPTVVDKDSISYSMLMEWFDDYLIANELIYPTGLGLTATSRQSAQVMLGGDVLLSNSNNDTRNGYATSPRGNGPHSHSPRASSNLMTAQISPRNYDEVSVHRDMSPRGMIVEKSQQMIHPPLRACCAPSSDLSVSLPTLIRNHNSTVVYIVTKSDEAPTEPMEQVEAKVEQPLRGSPRLFPFFGNKDEELLSSLPHAFINGCSSGHFYLLAPYGSATICSVTDTELVLGAVSGVVLLSSCERLSITVACRKLIVLNCVDCRINLASLAPSLIGSDCRGLTFGKTKLLKYHTICRVIYLFVCLFIPCRSPQLVV